jgi:hypothetical protein
VTKGSNTPARPTVGFVGQIHGWNGVSFVYERNGHVRAEPIRHARNLKALTNALGCFDPIFGRYGVGAKARDPDEIPAILGLWSFTAVVAVTIILRVRGTRKRHDQ